MFYDDEEYHNNGDPMMGNQNQGGFGFGGQPRGPQLNEAERAAESQRIQRESSERTQYMEIGASAAILFFISLNLIVYHNEPDCGYFQVWMLGSLGIYTLDLIMCMNQLMQVKKNGRENLWLLFITMVVVLAINTSWYIWGNILYYRNWETCSQISDVHPIGVNPGLTSAMRFMIFIGYITFCKCFFVTCCLAIGVPCLCYHMRQQSQPQWSGAAPDLLKRLARTEFQADPEAGATECCVCLVEFEANETVVTLPCNPKHVFHDPCVKQWLEQNNSCPLCKAPITREALQNQRP